MSQGGGGEDPRGEPCGSRARSNHDLDQLDPGIEALKRRAFARLERRRETARGHGPGNRYRSGWGHASRGESRERRRQAWIRRQGQSGRSRHVGRTQETEGAGMQDPDPIDEASSAVETKNLRRAIAGGRNLRGDRRCRLARRAQGQEGCGRGVATPKAARTGEEHPRRASREVRRGARNDRGSGADALPPEPESPEDRGNVRRGASARL